MAYRDCPCLKCNSGKEREKRIKCRRKCTQFVAWKLSMQAMRQKKKEDKDRYLCANGLERIEMEIPVSYHSIAHRNLDQLNKGSHPFVIPNKGYDEEKGLLPDLCKIEYYQSFEIL